MKKTLSIILLICFLVGILYCIIDYTLFNSYDAVKEYVVNNKEILLNLATKSLAYEEITSKPFSIREIKVYGENMVEFSVRSISNQYVGFYYSKENKPLAFQNSNIELIKETENVWKWQEIGDNKGKTIKIIDNWYYYEANF